MAGDSSYGRSVGSRAIDGFIALIAILPLLLTAHLPLADLPNHIGRQFILRDLSVSPILQQFYEVHWALVPNLAMDIFVAGARTVMPIELAVRLFCIATILMLFYGTRSVNWALSAGQGAIYRVAPLLCYGGPFQYGFVNYCFGIGLALVLFGWFLRLRGGSLLRLVLVFTPLSFLLLLCHFAAFGLFAIAVGSFELALAYDGAGGWSWRFVSAAVKRQLQLAIFLLPPFILYKLYSPTTALMENFQAATFWGKIESVAAITLFSSPAIELPLLVLGSAGLVLALIAKIVRVHHAAYFMAAFFALVWLSLPRAVLGSFYTDYRMPWGEAFFLVAGLIPGARVRHATAFGAWFGVLVLVRVGLIAMLWLSWEPTVAAIDHALGQLPMGARMKVVVGKVQSTSAWRRPALENVAGYLVARRQGFESNVFADIAGQILYLRPAYRQVREFVAPSALHQLPPQFDYVLVVHPESAWISPRLPLVCAAQGHLFRLLKVVAADHPLSATERQGICTRADA